MEIKEEQPISQECDFIENNSTFVDGTNSEGSSLGKFKNTDELLKAYQMLEKEFTKKCQKIKELEAANDNELNSPAIADNESGSPETAKQNVSEGDRQVKSIKEMYNLAKKTIANDTTDQQDVVNAKQNGYSVFEEQNEQIQNKLELKALEDEDFKKLIYSNSEIRNKFIENYLNEIQSQKSAPLMVNSASSNFCVMPKQKPRTLFDAGEATKELLKN